MTEAVRPSAKADVVDPTRFQTYQRGHPVLFRIVLSLIVGLVLEIALATLPFPPLKFVRQSADETLDVMTRLAALMKTEPVSDLRFAFVNIDEKSWLAWKTPLITPRDMIATLLARVAESKPAMIILDVDLSFRDEEKSEGILRNFLETYPAAAPPLILVQALAPSANSIHPEPRVTQYDSIKGGGNIFWALPSFERGDDDVVRRWQLATVACDAAAPVIIPSLQLQAVWSWFGNKREMLQPLLFPLRPANCDEPAPRKDFEIKLGGSQAPTIKINGDDTSSRIIYTMPWAPDSLALGPELPDGSHKIALWSADTVARVQPGYGIGGIEGEIAVIGGSFAESGDWYRTPLGGMPGALVLINAIDALAQHGTLKELPAGKRIAFGLGFIFFVSICVGFFRTPVAAFLSFVGIVGIMLAALPWLKSGLIINLAIPSLGILVVDFTLSFLHMIREVRIKGWRWIFKPPLTADPDREEHI